MRSLIDEMFRDTNDNWWTATRPEISCTQEFKTLFREKYWSESTQNVVRNNISNGRYEPQAGHTLTSYFLGKVCLARNLEPKIPEESLVIQLGYHYEDAIQRARRQGQIKTIQGMANLLEDHENDSQYKKNRMINQKYNRGNENYNVPSYNLPYNNTQNNNRNIMNRNPNSYPGDQPFHRNQPNYNQGNQPSNRNAQNPSAPHNNNRGIEQGRNTNGHPNNHDYYGNRYDPNYQYNRCV